VLYLIFNEGYLASSGEDLTRHDLAAEAIRLARMLVHLMPDEPEALGLLALMLLHESRRGARTSDDGALVLLEDQDRSRWDQTLIAEGQSILERALRQRRAGPYQVQAAISAVHADAPRAADTDWAQIVALYDALLDWHASPVLTLNRAVAIAMSRGPAAGLAEIEPLVTSDELQTYAPLHIAHADFLRRLGRTADAASAYQAALELTENATERAFLAQRLAALRA